MNRRDSIKSILLGSVAGGLALKGCNPVDTETLPAKVEWPDYGRTSKELERDHKLFEEEDFFNEHELATIAVLCDLIMPSDNKHGSAIDAGVIEFIEFIVKDLVSHQLPIRGGLMWLDHFSNNHFTKEFKNCTLEEQHKICDQIAYPDNDSPELQAGIKFFSRIKNLILTGYYTSKIGIEALGYKGNSPNVWDGVPEEVLKKHGLAYEKEWLAKCVDQEKRADVAKWDDDFNLIS